MHKLLLPMILTLAFAVRVGAAFFSGVNPLTFDSTIYLSVADGILNDSPSSSFPNGYPLLIALFKSVLPGEWLVPGLLWLNVLVSTAAVALTWDIGRRLTGSRKFAVAVSLALAVFPHQIHYVRLVMTEAPCLFLLTLAVWLLLRAGEASGEDALAGRFWAGIVFALAAAVRPSVMLIVPLLFVVGVAGRLTSRRGLAALGLGWALGLAFFFVLERAGFVRPPATVPNNLLLSVRFDSRNMIFVQYPPEEWPRAWQTYLSFAAHHPAQFLQQRLISLWELWGFWSLPGNKPENAQMLVRFVVAARFVLFLLAALAFWRGRRSFAVWTLAAPILVITVVHIGAFSNHRFIAPIEPMLFVLAGLTVREWFARRAT